MAGDRHSSEARNQRRRESSNNNHRKKRSASSRDYYPPNSSTSASDDNSGSRGLSAAALAQLNNEASRNRRHSTSGDGSQDYGSSPRRDRERERERARERELERDREWEREVERERERMRRESRRRESTARDERRRESTTRGEDRRRDSTTRDERRRRESTARRESTTRRESTRRDSTTREYRDRDRDRERDKGRDREKAALSADEYGYRRESSRLKKSGDRGGYREVAAGDGYDSYDERRKSKRDSQMRDKRKSGRVVSGAVLEEGRGKRWNFLRGGGGSSSNNSVQKEKEVEYLTDEQVRKKKRKIWIWIGVAVVLCVILIIVLAVVVSKKGSDNGDDNGDDKSGLDGIAPGSIPSGAPSWLNPFVWADTKDFNLTYTTETVGNLPVMGLFSSWDDSKKANDKVPALNQPWGDYAKRPARGVNVGGWLSLEPFITPSLFEYDKRLGIVDEYTLCTYLAARCESVLEQHYATFVTEDTFREIADAGLDHVRIPFSYWAVQTYDGDPYIFRTSWRYLLRAIEWCRKYGLRVNLDLHGIPGSQNGWNHSGRLGPIGWLNGTNGEVNRQRSLDVHDRLSKFFAQPRYQNIISHYGLANEPKMTVLSSQAVLDWTEAAHKLVRGNGVKNAVVVFGDGFRGLHNWQGELQDLDNAALDVHQYVIFNTNQIVFNHSTKVRYACAGWTEQTLDSMNRATGFGPTLVAEWSQADTDCARHLTNVGWGNRWTGTLLTGNATTDVTTPRCPLQDSRCDCSAANADSGQWSSSYKQFLKMFAEAQMASFEKGWGWFYWVWDTEDAPQWSYKKGLAAGVLPAKAYDRDFDCDMSAIPSFSDLSEAF